MIEFEFLILVRWINLKPVIQSEVDQKDKNKCHILTHIHGIPYHSYCRPPCLTTILFLCPCFQAVDGFWRKPVYYFLNKLFIQLKLSPHAEHSFTA